MTRPEAVETYSGLRKTLGTVVERKIPMHVGDNITLTPDELHALLLLLPARPEEEVKLRTKKLSERIKDVDGLSRLIGGKLRQVLKDRKLSNKVIPRVSRAFVADIHYAAVTPIEFLPTPTPKDHILSEKQLMEAHEAIEFSEKSDSVAYSLLDPVQLSIRGLPLEVNTRNYEQELNHGFSVPRALLSILKTLRYPESEKVLKDWLLPQFFKKDEDAERAKRFLLALVNFTSFLDSPTHIKLWEPQAILPDRGPELLLQPFKAIRDSIRHVMYHLSRVAPQLPITHSLNKMEKLVILRYGEVYRRTHQTSLYTFDPQGLKTTSEDFADLIRDLIQPHLSEGRDPNKVAKGTINLAESFGAESLEPLLRMANEEKWSDFANALDLQAKRRGIREYPEALTDTLRVLRQHPWRDALEINNYADIIRPKTDRLMMYVFTGTFGPFHMGHKRSIETIIEYINSQKDKDQVRGIQRILLVMPVTSISGVERYQKDAAQIGSLGARISSMLLQMSELEFNRNEVFMTTSGQPIPSQASDLVGRVRHTVLRLCGIITNDLAQAGLSAQFKPEIHHAMGADEVKKTPFGQIASCEEQPKKVTEDGGLDLIRGGSLLATLESGTDFAERTGITTVILNPSIPGLSSTQIIREIALNGKVIGGIEPAAQALVNEHWSPAAIERRRDINLSGQVRSIGDIYRQLVEG